MKVRELIDKLHDHDPEAEVHIEGCDCTARATDVSTWLDDAVLIEREE